MRGHGLVRKLSKVKRTQIDLIRLAPAEQFCGDSSFRTWNRVTFDVRWSDDYLTKGLTLLSDPTEDHSTVICPTLDTPLEQRKAVRDQLLG